MLPATPETIAHLGSLDTRLRWLAAWTIHNANHLRPSRDGVMVGGHKASCARMSSVRGHRVVPLGVDRFGQTGDLVDLFAAYALDEGATITAMTTALTA